MRLSYDRQRCPAPDLAEFDVAEGKRCGTAAPRDPLAEAIGGQVPAMSLVEQARERVSDGLARPGQGCAELVGRREASKRTRKPSLIERLMGAR